MSEIQVHQIVRVVSLLVAGRYLFEKSRRRPEFSFQVPNPVLFSPTKSDVLCKAFPSWSWFNLYDFGGQ